MPSASRIHPPPWHKPDASLGKISKSFPDGPFGFVQCGSKARGTINLKKGAVESTAPRIPP